MYEHFTDRARKVMQLANQEATRLHHEYIGTEHILLGLVKEGSGVAANVLQNLDIDLRSLRLEIQQIVQPGPGMVVVGQLQRTPRAERVIEYAVEEAHDLQHRYVGTEHLLLGLLREQEGVAAQVLLNLGLRREAVREEVLNLLGHHLDPIGGRSSFETPLRYPPAGVGLQSLPAAEFPEEIRQRLLELDTPIEMLTLQKEGAICEQDFERAAHMRDQEVRLTRKRKTLLREWRTSRMPDPAWLSWSNGTVVKIAREINDERRWGELPVLADALEEAGCKDQEILSHCRQPQEHKSGCWVVALLLGKFGPGL